MNNKYLVCLDIKSLYTYIPVDRCIECQHNHPRKSNFTLLLPISKLIKICTLCISHCYFQYSNILKTKIWFTYEDLSLVKLLHTFYLKFLESGPFKYIIPNTVCYFRYIDILLIYPQDLYLHSITDRLNNVEPSIKFTYELESNNTLAFLDILLGILTN